MRSTTTAVRSTTTEELQTAGNNAFEVTNADVILTTNHRGDRHETLEIAYYK